MKETLNKIMSHRFFVPIICIIGIVLLMLEKFIDGFGIFLFLFLILSVIFCLLFDINKSVCMLLILFNFNFFDFEIFSTMWYNILILTFILRFGIKYVIDVLKKKKEINWVLLLLSFGFVVVSLITLNIQNITYLFNSFSLLACSYIFYNYREDLSCKKLIHSYIFGVMVSAILGILFLLIPFSQKMFSFYVYEGRFQGLSGNPNTLQISIVISLSILLVMNYKEEVNGILFISLSIFLIIIGLLTKSKAFLICLCLLFVLYLCLLIRKYKKKGLIISLISVGLVAFLIFIFRKHFINIFDRVFKIQVDTFLDSILTGRWSIWIEYLTSWASSIVYVLFGCITCNRPVNIGTHSSYVELIYGYGIVGVLLTISLIYFYCIKVEDKKHRICGGLNAVPLIMFLILAIEETIIFTFILPFLMVVMFLFNNQQGGIEKK